MVWVSENPAVELRKRNQKLTRSICEVAVI